MKIIFLTSSEGKIKEAQVILGDKFSIEQVDLDIDEIQAIDGKKVVEKKAKQAFKILKKPVLVEDTSLYFDAWNNLPGALIRWFLKTVECEGICKMMKNVKNRQVTAETNLGFYDGKLMKIFSGKIKGKIPLSPKGEHGFGWDPIFIPEGHQKSFGQMTRAEKNKISMRKIALEKLRNYLLKIWGEGN